MPDLDYDAELAYNSNGYVGDGRSLLRLNRWREANRQRQLVAKIILETGEGGEQKATPSNGADPERLRGIPVIGVGTGASPHTNPEIEALRKVQRQHELAEILREA